MWKNRSRGSAEVYTLALDHYSGNLKAATATQQRIIQASEAGTIGLPDV